MFLNVFSVFSILVWAFAFHEAYRDVETANGSRIPICLMSLGDFLNDKIITAVIVGVILIFTLGGCCSALTVSDYSSDDSNTYYYVSDSSPSSSHYGGLTIPLM